MMYECVQSTSVIWVLFKINLIFNDGIISMPTLCTVPGTSCVKVACFLSRHSVVSIILVFVNISHSSSNKLKSDNYKVVKCIPMTIYCRDIEIGRMYCTNNIARNFLLPH